MLYEQGDRVEFRFFSPTLEAEKLNHYVSLANVVYRRLAGKEARLSRRSQEYFTVKMMKVNKLSLEVASASIAQVNTLPTYAALQAEERIDRERQASILASRESHMAEMLVNPPIIQEEAPF